MFAVKKLIEKIKENNSKVLINNFLSLTVLQALNILLPFLVMPFLIQTVGIEKFGLLTFIHTIILTLQVFTEYGFNTIATRDISVQSGDLKKVNATFNEVLFTKIILALLCFVFLVLLVVSFEKFRINALLYFLYFGIIVGQSIFPVWLFQGLQEMKYITYVNVIFKTIFTLCIFVFVKQKADIWLVPLFLSLGFICSGLASLFIAYYKFHIRYQVVSLSSVKKQMKNAYYMFLSEVQMAAISYINILILGFLIGNAAVGVYSSAEKVIRAIGNMQTPIINAVYPHISKLMITDRTKALLFINNLRKIGSLVFIVFSIILFVFSPLLFKYIYGNEPQENVILIFRILLVFPLFSFLDQVFGKLVLLTSGKEKVFFRVFFFAAIISVILVFINTYLFGNKGTAAANAIVQFFIMIGMYYYSKPILKS